MLRYTYDIEFERSGLSSISFFSCFACNPQDDLAGSGWQRVGVSFVMVMDRRISAGPSMLHSTR
jgi:hypothetical protein